MNNITLRVELGPETQAKLDKILEAVTGHNCSGCVASAVAMTKDLAEAAAAAPTATETPTPETTPPAEEPAPSVEPEPAAEPEKDEAPEAPAITRDDIQALVMKLASPTGGKRAEARAVVNEYAERIGLIPEDKFPEVWAKLKALEV